MASDLSTYESVVELAGCERNSLLSNRIEMLTGKDRVLMTMYHVHGSTFRQIAHVTSLSAATVARKVRRLTEKLLDGQYIICLRNCRLFTAAELDIARDYFLADLPIKAMMTRHRMSRYQISRTIFKIEKLIAIIRERNPRAA